LNFLWSLLLMLHLLVKLLHGLLLHTLNFLWSLLLMLHLLVKLLHGLLLRQRSKRRLHTNQLSLRNMMELQRLVMRRLLLMLLHGLLVLLRCFTCWSRTLLKWRRLLDQLVRFLKLLLARVLTLCLALCMMILLRLPLSNGL
jgi:hypothetical protein